MKSVLKLEDFSFGFGEEEVLQIDTLEIFPRRVVGLLGPSGSGKSTLLNSIIFNVNSPSYWQSGKIFYNGQSLTKECVKPKNFGFISQKSRLYTDTIIENFLDGLGLSENISMKKKEAYAMSVFKALELWDLFKDVLHENAIKQSLGVHKLLLIAKAISYKPKVLFLDEILSNVSIQDEDLIIRCVKLLSKYTTIVLITHNKEEARDLCDEIVLVSGGKIHEHTDVYTFFKKPNSQVGIEFLQSGSAWYVNPDQIVKKNNQLTLFRRFSSMCEFYWIVPNKLGGMQKPGLLTELIDDLKTMQQLGVNVLVTLQEKAFDKEKLDGYGIEWRHFPIVDMSYPEINKTIDFLESLKRDFEDDKSIVYHCKAGMGRTGLMLACHLIWNDGLSAIQAIEKIRNVNHKYIQTREQFEFISHFANHLQQSKCLAM